MPRMRRKKKTSVSSDDGQLSDEEGGTRKKSGKRRSSKKEIEHLPTIEDESKPSMVRISKEILNNARPQSIAQAAALPGITPAAINAILIYMRKKVA